MTRGRRAFAGHTAARLRFQLPLRCETVKNGPMRALRSISATLLVSALIASVSGCSIFGSSSAPARPSARAAPSAPAGRPTGPGDASVIAEREIAANWITFFSWKSGVFQRAALVQDGSVFLPIFEASGGPTAPVTAVVNKVALISPTQADVHYSILLGGQPALPGQTGVAVLVNSHWLVSAATYCNLLIVESGGTRTYLPAVCQTPSGPAG